MPEVCPIITPEQVRQCYPVMVQLRPHLTENTFVEQVLRQFNHGHYHMAAVFDGDTLTAVAGYRLSECLADGRFLYVDDLITDETRRSQGNGGLQFDWLVEEAWRNGCKELHLDSGVQRFDAHRFYLAKRMAITSHHFGLVLESD